MSVESPPSNDVTAGRRQCDLTAPRQHRCGEQNRRADLSTELRIELRGANALGVDQQCVSLLPVGGYPGRANELDQSLDIADARNVFECDRLIAE